VQGRGQPLLIDVVRQKEIEEEITTNKQLKIAMNERELKKLLYRKAVSTDQSNGGNGIMRKGEISRNTITNYTKLLNIKKEKGQKTTNARREAMFDLRNFISMAVMNASICDNLSHHCIGNLDATQFLLQYTDQQRLISIDKLSPTTKTEESTMDLFVKQFFFVTAAGYSGPPLFVISHHLLSDEQIVVLPIDGLSFSYDGKSTGYIVFCNSRGGNKSFFHWLFTTYIVECVKIFQSRQTNNDSFYLVLDGEATQIQALDDIDVRNILNNSKIDVGKGPASCSGCCGNALDCGNFFKSIKSSLRGKSGIGQENSSNSELELFISNKITENNNINNLSADKRNKICKGVVHLLHHEMQIFSPSIHQKSFDKIGMTGELKLERTLSCYPKYKEIPKQQLELIKTSMDELIRIFRENGEVKESEYDTLGIMMREEGGEGERKSVTNRDELVVYRQRAVLLTSIETIKRRNHYFEERKRIMEEGEKKRKEKEMEKGKKKEDKEGKQREKKRKREEQDESDHNRKKEREESDKRMSRILSLRGREGKGMTGGKGNRKEGGDKKKKNSPHL